MKEEHKIACGMCLALSEMRNCLIFKLTSHFYKLQTELAKTERMLGMVFNQRRRYK